MQKHKLLAFLLALLVSIGLWVYAVTVVNPDDTIYIRGVKVRIVGVSELESDNLMLTGGEGQTVNVEISGRRSDLKQLTSASLEAIADVSKIDRAGTYEVSWTLDPPSTVASGDISLVSTNSNKITVVVSEVNTRPEIPVEVEYTGSLPEGYIRDPAVLSAESISVTGPAEEVEKIEKAVVSVDLTEVTQTVTEDVSCVFLDEDGQALTLSEFVTVSTPVVRVSVPISCYKQVKLRVSMTAGGGATEDDTLCIIEPDTISVKGTREALEGLDEIVIKQIDLAACDGTQVWKVTPELPAGVTSLAADPSVEIRLSFRGLVTRKFTIKCTDIQRLDEDSTLTFGEQNVVVTVRGKAEAVNALTQEDILISADLTQDYDPNTRTVTLKIQLPAGTRAGVVGAPYTVLVVDADS